MWQRSEPRRVRPFFGGAALEDCLKNVGIRFGYDDPVHTDSRVTVDQDVLSDKGLDVVIDLGDVDIPEVLGQAANRYGIVVLVRDPIFKRRFVRAEWPLSGEIPDSITVAPNELAAYSHATEVQLSVALCLLEDTDPVPGWPCVAGSWLARKRISVHVPKPKRSGFDIQPLTEEIRQLNRLAAGTLVFAELDGDVTAAIDEGQTFATCYVAPSVLSALRSERSDKVLETIVEAEIVVALASAITVEVTSDTEVTQGSPLSSLLKRLGDNEPMDTAMFCDLAADYQRLRGHVHGELKVVQALEKL